MKKITIVLFAVAIALTSCGGSGTIVTTATDSTKVDSAKIVKVADSTKVDTTSVKK